MLKLTKECHVFVLKCLQILFKYCILFSRCIIHTIQSENKNMLTQKTKMKHTQKKVVTK